MKHIDNHIIYWLKLPNYLDYYTQGYIGVTKNFERRMHNHKCQPSSPKLKNYINFYGWNNITKEILVKNIDEEFAYFIESELRPRPGIGWNTNKGGELPPDNRGLNHPNYGKRGEGTPMFNKKHTQEFKERMSGKNNPMANLLPNQYPCFKDCILAISMDTNNVVELAGTKQIKEFGFDPACVYKCANKTQNYLTHKRYKFYWKNEYICA